MSYFPYIIASIASLLYGGKLVWTHYELPKEGLLIWGALSTAAYWLMYGLGEIPLNTSIGIWLACLVGWWFFTSILAKRRWHALYHCGLYVANVILAVAMTPETFKTGCMILVGGALLNAAIAILQRDAHWEPFKSSANTLPHYAIGTIGNQNMLACYLVPHVFMCMYLLDTGWWWLLAAAIITYATFISTCRTALIGLVGGMLYAALTTPLWPAVLVVLTLGGIAYELRMQGYGHHGSTWKERKAYWQVALKQLPRSALVGLGFGGFQLKIAYLQREINTETNGKFLDPANYECPYPQRCHNDYLQWFLDLGVLGGLGLGTLMLISLVVGTLSLSPDRVWLVAALVAVAINGLGFHSWYVVMSNSVWWILVLAVIRTQPMQLTVVMSPLVWIILCICVVLILYATFRRITTDALFALFMKTAKIKWLEWALHISPDSGTYHVYSSLYWAKEHHLGKNIQHSMQAIANYDGVDRLWELWSNVAVNMSLTGAFALGERAYKEALSFLPTMERACNGLRGIENILSNVQQANPNARIVRF